MIHATDYGFLDCMENHGDVDMCCSVFEQGATPKLTAVHAEIQNDTGVKLFLAIMQKSATPKGPFEL